MAHRMQRFTSFRLQRSSAASGRVTTAGGWRRGMRSLLAALLAVMALTVTAISAPRASAAPATSGPCEQAPAQSARDRASYTPAELDRYGLPQRTPGEPFAKWAAIVRGAGQRICSAARGEARSPGRPPPASIGLEMSRMSRLRAKNTPRRIWITSCPALARHQVLILTIMAPRWLPGLGLGARLAGRRLFRREQWPSRPIMERPGRPRTRRSTRVPRRATRRPTFRFSSSATTTCMSRHTTVGPQDCMFIQRISDGLHGGSCYGPTGYTGSAEAIVEYSQSVAPYFARFGTVTFKGVGITDNAIYKGIDKLRHATYELYTHNCNSQVAHAATVGAFQSDSGNNPPVKYDVTWLHQGFYCPGI